MHRRNIDPTYRSASAQLCLLRTASNTMISFDHSLRGNRVSTQVNRDIPSVPELRQVIWSGNASFPLTFNSHRGEKDAEACLREV